MEDFEIRKGVLIKYRGNASHVVVPEGVKRIARNAFDSCSSVELPESVSQIGKPGDYPFGWCRKLQHISVSENNPHYASRDGVLYDKQFHTLLCFPCAKKTAVIPESVTRIGDSAFYMSGELTYLIIPEGVTEIGKYAFFNCWFLKSVKLPASLRIIEEHAFSRCENLESLRIPEHLQIIGEHAFHNCESLTDIVIPETVTHIGNGAFNCCHSLKLHVSHQNPAYTIRDNILYDTAFRTLHSCLEKKTDYSIPEGVTAIADNAFYSCESLQHITFPESLISIGERAFFNCQHLTDLILPEHLLHIGKFAFSHCKSLTELVIPSSMEHIKDYVFDNCINLKRAVFPDNVSEIDSYVFMRCSNLTSITCRNVTFSPVPIGADQINTVLYLISGKNFSLNIVPESFKHAVIWDMFAVSPEDTDIFHYLTEHFGTASRALIDKNAPAFMQTILDDGRFITEDNIDSLIEYAIEKQAYEIQVMLTNYRYQHFGGEDSETSIRKKFEL